MGQGDSQLIVFPSGFTILNDIFEASWNTCKGAEHVAERVLAITGRRHIDVGVISHWCVQLSVQCSLTILSQPALSVRRTALAHRHLDHLGYAGYGGFWCAIEKGLLTFGKLIDRDGGVWRPGTTEVRIIIVDLLNWQHAEMTWRLSLRC